MGADISTRMAATNLKETLTVYTDKSCREKPGFKSSPQSSFTETSQPEIQCLTGQKLEPLA